MVKFRSVKTSSTSSVVTLTRKGRFPSSGTQLADGSTVNYDLTSFKNRARIYEVHCVPTVDTQLILSFYENPNRNEEDQIYEVETTTTGDKVHDAIKEGLRFIDEKGNSTLYLSIVNKSAGADAAFNLKIKYESEV